MSKSVGNVIDPLDVMEEYGTDATRLALLGACSQTLDIAFSPDRFEGARRFCNKLWNASRFVLQSDLWDDEPPSAPTGDLALPERWILSRLSTTQAAFDEAIESFEFSEAADILYHFVWDDFCDWYLEMAKLGMEARRESVAATLHHVLEAALRMAHPMIPFITEEIWQKLPKRAGAPDSIVIAEWPRAETDRLDPGAEAEMDLLQSVVLEIRRFRHEHKIGPRQQIAAVVRADPEHQALIGANTEELKGLAALSELRTGEQPAGWSRVATGGVEVYLPLGELVDVGAERERMERGLAEAEELAKRAQTKLDNPKFVGGAPPDVVEKVRAQLAEHEDRAARLRAQLVALEPGASEELGS
jgi:valyl-tRNA synthetase